jgi:hypothetical protein
MEHVNPVNSMVKLLLVDDSRGSLTLGKFHFVLIVDDNLVRCEIVKV